MRFLRRAGLKPSRVGILPGAFHPPTRAHLGLATAALASGEADEVLFVMPGIQPHKQYERVSLSERVELLLASVDSEPRFSVALTEGGLFLEIARECRCHYAEAALRFLCGRDTAERIVSWTYETVPPIEQQLKEFELLVAPRQGVFEPPAHLAAAVSHLPVAPDYDTVSSTEVRQRIEAGQPWSHLVPSAIVDRVKSLYL
jgi:nicotinate (nicotinamide) nucleotide adenylyltransferase